MHLSFVELCLACVESGLLLKHELDVTLESLLELVCAHLTLPCCVTFRSGDSAPYIVENFPLAHRTK